MESENWFHGYKPDLMFKNQNEILIVECGDTNPVKLIEYFERAEVKRVAIISYPKNGDNLIYQHTFDKNAEMDDYIRIKRDIEMGKIKKIVRRR